MTINRKTASDGLLKFRESHGITQDRLSEKTGISKTTIVNIETGKIKPQATTVYKINEYIKTVESEIVDY